VAVVGDLQRSDLSDNSVSVGSVRRNVIRFVALMIAVALIGYPPFLIYAITVPGARSRTGSYLDFLAFGGAMLAIYGGVLLGAAIYWARVGGPWRLLRSVGVFKAGVWGAFGGGVGVVVSAGIHGLATQGSFEKGIGTLWGLIVIFALLLGALVSGGMGLLLYGLRPSASPRGPTLGNGGRGVRADPSS
jgi:hypothetical protein